MGEDTDQRERAPSTSREPYRYDWPPVIETEWLEAVAGSRFFYPCSGPDTGEPLEAFYRVLSDFTFSDPEYRRRPRLHRDHEERQRPIRAPDEPRGSRLSHHSWDLETSSETFLRPEGGQVVVTYDARHAGQVLMERFAEKSIGVFIHRGDGDGEGGSGLCFLGETSPFGGRQSFFRTLTARLSDRALVVTDGSNTGVPWLSHFYSQPVSSAEAAERLKCQQFPLGGFTWRCVGWMGRRNGPALVWGLERTAGT